MFTDKADDMISKLDKLQSMDVDTMNRRCSKSESTNNTKATSPLLLLRVLSVIIFTFQRILLIIHALCQILLHYLKTSLLRGENDINQEFRSSQTRRHQEVKDSSNGMALDRCQSEDINITRCNAYKLFVAWLTSGGNECIAKKDEISYTEMSNKFCRLLQNEMKNLIEIVVEDKTIMTLMPHTADSESVCLENATTPHVITDSLEVKTPDCDREHVNKYEHSQKKDTSQIEISTTGKDSHTTSGEETREAFDISKLTDSLEEKKQKYDSEHVNIDEHSQKMDTSQIKTSTTGKDSHAIDRETTDETFIAFDISKLLPAKSERLSSNKDYMSKCIHEMCEHKSSQSKSEEKHGDDDDDQLTLNKDSAGDKYDDSHSRQITQTNLTNYVTKLLKHKSSESGNHLKNGHVFIADSPEGRRIEDTRLMKSQENGVHGESRMKEELQRVLSFKIYPRNAPVSALVLAQDGFFLLAENSDEVMCAFCEVRHRNWTSRDDVSTVHVEISPECPLVLGRECGNIPMPFSQHKHRNNATLRHASKNIADSSDSLVSSSSASNSFVTSTSIPSLSEGASAEASLSLPNLPATTKTAEGAGASSLSSSAAAAATAAFDTSGFSFPTGCQSTDVHNRFVSSSKSSDGSAASSSRNGDALSSTPNDRANNSSVTNATPSTISQYSPVSSISSGRLPHQSSSTFHTNNASPNSDTGTPTPMSTLNSPVPTPTASNNSVATRPSGSNSQSDVSPIHNTAESAVQQSSNVRQIPAQSRSHTGTPHQVQSASVNSVTRSTTPSRNLPNAAAENMEVADGTSFATNSPSTSTDGVQSTPVSSTVARVGAPSVNFQQLGIVVEQPKRPEFAPIAARLATYEGWPEDHYFSVEDLTRAGFYYAGYGDCVRCFFCSGGLRNWEPEDDMWVEHARWFPKCPFLRETIGMTFVNAVGVLKEAGHATISFNDALKEMGVDASNFNLATVTEDQFNVDQDAGVKALISLGFDQTQIYEAAKQLFADGTSLNSEALLEALDGRYEAPVGDSPQSEAIEKLRDNIQEIRQIFTCKVCLDRQCTTVFLPCGHLVSCRQCSLALKNCPICREHIRGRVKTALEE